MKKRTILSSLLAGILLLSGPFSQAKEAPVKERGWIGGHYECAKRSRTFTEYFLGADHTSYTFPPAVAKFQAAGMLVESLGTNTPAYLAGVRPGDLILAAGGQPVTDWRGFWETINSRPPGSVLPVKVWRAGQTAEYQVTVGREKTRRLGYFTIMLPGYLGDLHPFPTPEAPRCSLIALGCEKKDDRPAEFSSAKEQYEHSCHPQAKQTSYETGWRLWLAIFELKNGRQILAQETVPAAGAHL